MPFNFNNSTERITSLNGDINIAYLLGISNDRKPKYLSVTAIKNWITPQIDVKILGYIQNDDITEGDTNNQRDAVAPSVRASAEYSRRKATQAKNEVTGDTNNNWYNGDRTLWGLNNKLEALDYQNNARINGELLTRAIDIFSIYTDDPGIADLEPLLDPITASDPDNPILEMGTITLNKLYRILTEGGFQLHVQFNRDKDVSGNDPQYDERVNNKQFIFRFPISVIHRNGKATRVFLYLQVLGEVINDSLMEYTIQWDGSDNKYCLMCSVEDPSEVNVVGDDTDDWDNQKTLYGLKKNLDDSISAEETARQNADTALRGTDDDPTSITIRGARALAQQLTTQTIDNVLGTSDRDYDGNPNLSPTVWENRYGSISGIVPVTSNSLVVGNDNVAVKSELLLNAIRAGKLSDGGTRLTIGFDINNGIISALNGKSYKVEDLEKASGWIMQIAIQSEDTTNTPATNWYYIYVLVVTPLGAGVIQQSTTILSANHVKFIELTNNDYNVKGDLWDRLIARIEAKVENNTISSSTDSKTGIAPSYPKVRSYADGKVSNAAITENTAVQETVAPSYKQVRQFVIDQDNEVFYDLVGQTSDPSTAITIYGAKNYALSVFQDIYDYSKYTIPYSTQTPNGFVTLQYPACLCRYGSKKVFTLTEFCNLVSGNVGALGSSYQSRLAPTSVDISGMLGFFNKLFYDAGETPGTFSDQVYNTNDLGPGKYVALFFKLDDGRFGFIGSLIRSIFNMNPNYGAVTYFDAVFLVSSIFNSVPDVTTDYIPVTPGERIDPILN